MSGVDDPPILLTWPGIFGIKAQVALMHYSRCREGGGSYMGMYFNGISESAAGYAFPDLKVQFVKAKLADD